MAEHRCHAQGCGVAVPPRLLMCARHWRMVPKPLQDRVWATYRRGQEITKDPTPEYMDAQRAAVEAVAESRGGRQPGDPCGWPSIDGGICVSPAGPDGRCRAHGGDLPARVKDWPETWRYLFEERAGIMEFEAGMTRPDAEKRAEQVLREEFRR